MSNNLKSINDEVVTATTMEALIKWLEQAGVDLSLWGRDGAKTAVHLHRELQEKDCILHDNPPRRIVRVAQIIIQRENEILIEITQEMGNGRLRHRALPPSEKMKQGETVKNGMLRCLQEELGITNAVMQPNSHRQHSRTMESSSYPGLVTQYTVHTMKTAVSSLPNHDFWRNNTAYNDGDPIRRHQWGWRNNVDIIPVED